MSSSWNTGTDVSRLFCITHTFSFFSPPGCRLQSSQISSSFISLVYATHSWRSVHTGEECQLLPAPRGYGEWYWSCRTTDSVSLQLTLCWYTKYIMSILSKYSKVVYSCCGETSLASKTSLLYMYSGVVNTFCLCLYPPFSHCKTKVPKLVFLHSVVVKVNRPIH